MMAFTITDRDVVLSVNGHTFTVPRKSVNGEKLAKGIMNGLPEEELLKLADPVEHINAIGGGTVTIQGGVAKYNGSVMPGCITRRMLDLLAHGLPIQHIVNFYVKLTGNPSNRAVNELFTFLENKNIPITPEGTLLMYKAIRNDWKDKHSGRFENKPGNELSMPRNEVCDNADIHCSYGFHAGSLEYVQWFADNFGNPEGDRIVLVEVDPADVVSIPKDCNCQKLRTCRYKVLQEYQGRLPEGGVRSTANPYDNEQDDDGNDDIYPDDASEDDVVLTRSELEILLGEARDEGAEAARQDIKDSI